MNILRGRVSDETVGVVAFCVLLLCLQLFLGGWVSGRLDVLILGGAGMNATLWVSRDYLRALFSDD